MKIRKFVPGVTGRERIIAKGASFGDRRYRYKPWWALTAFEKKQVAARYPHNTPCIPDSAYAYPVDKNGNLPRGRASRTLLWSYEYTKRKTATCRRRS